MIITEDFKDRIFSNEKSLKLAKRFIRKCSNSKIYIDRLVYELYLIIRKGFVDYLIRVCDILELTKGIPHITRGSAGSSLVCYLLGISNIDPVKENISFARFLNVHRETMPDIDIDFPHNKRDKVFERIYKKWNGQVARISNHIYYKEKSALRQAIRDEGIHKFIPKHKCSANLFPDKKEKILERQQDLLGTFRGYSLHCGGITFYEDGIPKELILNTSKNKKEKEYQIQIKYNKDDVDENKKFKIDILSNRGLAQLFDISDKPIEEYSHDDLDTEELLISNDNIGLTFAESPVMRKTMAALKPVSVKELALCLAIIRPAAASGGRKTHYLKNAMKGDYSNYIIYDDDAINYIRKIANCSEDSADKYRRAFSKNKWRDISYFKAVIKDFNQKDDIIDNLGQLQKYSFCKSHAYSYAKLVWALAYQKAHNPKKFWIATLNNCNSMYRTWVHFSEAKKAGIKLTLGKKPWKLCKDKLVGFGNDKNRGKVTKEMLSSKDRSINEYKLYGYWTDPKFLPNMYVKVLNENIGYVEFQGLIATGRQYRNKTNDSKNTFITIGYKTGYFIDITLQGLYKVSIFDAIRGKGYVKEYVEGSNYLIIDVKEHKFEIF